ncbi:hypothetical protein BJ508DRAFT_133674 [Ascobolus immersus RN42]|uniref:NF-X1-type domain-containing protein n=1 Tax=Ascobolus immersus RN42 TaxID=1160509 RepID=A0A3N4IXN7_ASCIM|nr:hypothetical protein BJ508DRAFT_133674 [Ascobolus immersus RN42]
MRFTKAGELHSTFGGPNGQTLGNFSKEGGCRLPFSLLDHNDRGKKLPCGHSCPRQCHSQGMHDTVPCSAVIPKTGLPCGHILTSILCWQKKEIASLVYEEVCQKEEDDNGSEVHQRADFLPYSRCGMDRVSGRECEHRCAHSWHPADKDADCEPCLAPAPVWCNNLHSRIGLCVDEQKMVGKCWECVSMGM